MLKIFLIAVLFAPGGEQYQDLIKPFETMEQCESERAVLAEKAKAMIGFGFTARCAQVKFGPSA